MTEWTTIRVRQDAKDRAQSKKPDGVTWSEWIADDARMGPIADEVAERVAERIED